MRSVIQVSGVTLLALIGFVVAPTATFLLCVTLYFSLMYLARDA